MRWISIENIHNKNRVRIFYYCRVLCISCILLIIFVYLLTINFVRVLIVYFQNIVYSCITINFSISYVQIAHIYYIPCTCNYNILYTFVTSYEFACICAVYSTFLMQVQIQYHMLSVTKKNFREGEGGKTRSWKLC